MKVKITSISILAIIILLSFFLILSTGCCFNLSSMSSSSQEAETTEETEETSADTEKTQDAETSEEVTEETEDTDDSGEQEAIKSGFDQLLSGGAGLDEIFKFIDENIVNADAETATYMVAEASKKNKEEEFSFGDKFLSSEIQQAIIDALDESYIVDMEKLKQTDNPELKALIDETIAKKFKIIGIEGMFAPIVDYTAYGSYRDFLTNEMNDYLDIRVDDSMQPSVMDAGITVEMDEFLRRINKTFVYMENYPDSPRYAEIKQLNSGRLHVYLGGIDNTPVFDSSGNIYPDKLDEFEDFAQQYEGSRLGEVLDDYLSLLEAEGYMQTQAVMDFISNL